MSVPEVELDKVPRRFLRVALVCLDQRPSDYGFVVLANASLFHAQFRKERELLIDALEKFCLQLREPEGKAS